MSVENILRGEIQHLQARVRELEAERDALRTLLLRVASEVRYSDHRVAESIDAALAGEKP